MPATATVVTTEQRLYQVEYVGIRKAKNGWIVIAYRNIGPFGEPPKLEFVEETVCSNMEQAEMAIHRYLQPRLLGKVPPE